MTGERPGTGDRRRTRAATRRQAGSSAGGAERPAPRPLTAERLRKGALHHLARYACSREQLRQVLARRVKRAADAGVAEVGEADIAQVVARCVELGFLDDRVFARQKAASLARQGRSRPVIAMKLQQLGLSEDDVAVGLETIGLAAADELQRAAAFARRRRLGPYRPARERAERFQRDLAALARQGFPYGLARQVLEAEDEAALARLLAEAS